MVHKWISIKKKRFANPEILTDRNLDELKRIFLSLETAEDILPHEKIYLEKLLKESSRRGN
jgi:hypothetical protein